jgi:hypothetical protein
VVSKWNNKLLTDHPSGNYRFLPGIAPYSCGIAASPGFEVIHVTFQRPAPYRQGFEKVAKILKSAGRPKVALCGVSLRSPRPHSFQGFSDFNADYTEILKSWGVFVNGVNPIARTNVAPVIDPPRDPVLYGFSFTKPCSGASIPTFVVAGAGELPEGILSQEGIVARGDSSDEGLKVKARFVMDLMESRLRGLEVNWSFVNTINVYAAHSLTPLLPEIILGRVGAAGIRGIHWHYSRPPIEDIEFEMDVRGTGTEINFP